MHDSPTMDQTEYGWQIPPSVWNVKSLLKKIYKMSTIPDLVLYTRRRTDEKN